MIAAGRSAARAMRAPLRAGRALMPCRLSRLVRLWLSMGCPGTRPGNSHRGVCGPWWIMSRVGGRSASSLQVKACRDLSNDPRRQPTKSPDPSLAGDFAERMAEAMLRRVDV
jgi:hypothetical protein